MHCGCRCIAAQPLRPPGKDGTLSVVRPSPFKYLSIIVLIVSRLILGELAYAMPQERGSVVDSSLSTTVAAPPHCPEHLDAQPQMDASMQDASTQDTQKDCCKSSGCKCPCAHLTAMVVLSPAATSHGVVEKRLRPSAAAPANDRLNALFRPPA